MNRRESMQKKTPGAEGGEGTHEREKGGLKKGRALERGELVGHTTSRAETSGP